MEDVLTRFDAALEESGPTFCKDRPELFADYVSPKDPEVQLAQDACDVCEVAQICLEYAEAVEAGWGVWGAKVWVGGKPQKDRRRKTERTESSYE